MNNIFEGLEIVNYCEKEKIKSFLFSKGINVSDDFAEFYGKYNGSYGFVRNDGAYVNIYGIDEIIQANKDYAVSEYTETAFIFGNDGGDEAFAYDYVSGKYVVTPYSVFRNVH